MSGRAPRLIGSLAALFALLAVTAASASASAVYVSSATAVTGGKSCAQPGYNKIQDAINSGAATVDVCGGTYTEQLEISKAVKLTAVSGSGTATVATPAEGFHDSASACDTKEGLKQIDGISICTSETVSITGLDVQTLIKLEDCGQGLNGIFVGGGGTLKANNLTIDGASTTVAGYKGCQQGIAVEVGSASHKEIGHAALKQVTVTGYQKNGPTVKFAGSSLSISASTITGEGPSPFTAQNGVQISFGAEGKVKSSTISGNECDVASCGANGEQASGILLYEAAPGSSVTYSTVKENDNGLYYISGSATQPTSPEARLTNDVFTGNRYEGIGLDQGKAALKNDTINGPGLIGIILYQYAGQTLASESTASGTKISGQTKASIEVSSDKAPSDIPGKFTFSNGTAAEPVLVNESNNFEVIF